MNLKIISIFILLSFVTLISSQKCGVQKVQPVIFGKSSRIINGQQTVPNSWPWIVSIGQSGQNGQYEHACGGTLVDYDLVITAAHCLIETGIDPFSFFIQIGVSQLRTYVNDSNSFRILKYSYEKNYDLNKPQNGNDIGLIKLNKKVTLSANISFICLPSASSFNLVQNKSVVIVGW